ncbi:hypothetical protein L228DRAFT_155519 [Xylona heveae TC161]|uniref:Uncharacterized protein n=1 Tax=Xylona heveae (strain CBS 132557 / TC161) TaxID=1328760 RepID=A0A165FYV5_XYLHT|nr:hypothetical protein L228DRAFT_155519 [Xylona heveae TC161]KZF21545.1 hypothetical protein L228DRAFT_155519 [Xylona heveae TC161]
MINILTRHDNFETGVSGQPRRPKAKKQNKVFGVTQDRSEEKRRETLLTRVSPTSPRPPINRLCGLCLCLGDGVLWTTKDVHQVPVSLGIHPHDPLLAPMINPSPSTALGFCRSFLPLAPNIVTLLGRQLPHGLLLPLLAHLFSLVLKISFLFCFEYKLAIFIFALVWQSLVVASLTCGFVFVTCSYLPVFAEQSRL